MKALLEMQHRSRRTPLCFMILTMFQSGACHAAEENAGKVFVPLFPKDGVPAGWW